MFKNIEATDANIYLFDAPNNSLTAGGIIFPKGRNRLECNAFESALDSVLRQSFEMDSILLHSLKGYERNIGVLRSRPTSELAYIFHHTENPDSACLSDIDRNSVNDIYYVKATVADSIMDKYEYGYLLDDAEVADLLQSYREMLPEFTDSIGKKELKVLRKQFKRQKKGINRRFYRNVLPKNPYLAQIFYYKTGIMANDARLHSTTVNELKRRKVELTDFNVDYASLISKMKKLEDMYHRNLFEPVFYSRQEVLLNSETINIINMEPTREQLQTEILEILYQKSLQKPIWVSCTEVFWSIDNLKVSERSVKEILDWLVKNDLVIYQADKYQISKREFVDISRRKALEKKETEEDAEVREPDYGTITPQHPTRNHPWSELEHPQPIAKSSNIMSAVIALIAFLLSGTLVGILLFNSLHQRNASMQNCHIFQIAYKSLCCKRVRRDIYVTHTQPIGISRAYRPRWKRNNASMPSFRIFAKHSKLRSIC